MVKTIRQQYNSLFTDTKYQAFLQSIHKTFHHVPPFRIAETPVFIDSILRTKLLEACHEISAQICQPDFKQKSQGAILPKYQVANEDEHTLFLQMDFGICEDPDGSLSPKLVEIQGFPSLYFFQDLLAEKYREHFDIPAEYSHLFLGLQQEEYRTLLRRNILGSSHPENVVLLDIQPDRQTTRIDFLCTQKHLGLAIKCISEIQKEGRDLYYLNDKGKRVGIERIYNRVIFDELDHFPDLPRTFYFRDEAQIEWAGHPNWFFRISKHTLPLLKSQYIPETMFLDQLQEIPEDLTNYVLKPLYSFAGTGVLINLNRFDIQGISDPENYILQRKVKYASCVASPNEPTKCEVRMLMIWEPNAARPTVVTNLVRLSKGEMVGVKYNRDKDWVGASIGFFEQE